MGSSCQFKDTPPSPQPRVPACAGVTVRGCVVNWIGKLIYVKNNPDQRKRLYLTPVIFLGLVHCTDPSSSRSSSSSGVALMGWRGDEGEEAWKEPFEPRRLQFDEHFFKQPKL